MAILLLFKLFYGSGVHFPSAPPFFRESAPFDLWMALFCFPLISHKFEGCAKDNHPENSPRRILLRTLRDVYKACFRQNSPFYIGGDLYFPWAQKHVLRRYALFSTHNPRYSKTAQYVILGSILDFTLKIPIIPRAEIHFYGIENTVHATYTLIFSRIFGYLGHLE